MSAMILFLHVIPLYSLVNYVADGQNTKSNIANTEGVVSTYSQAMKQYLQRETTKLQEAVGRDSCACLHTNLSYGNKMAIKLVCLPCQWTLGSGISVAIS